MNDLTMNKATPEDAADTTQELEDMIEHLKTESDETLRILIKEAIATLEARATARRREAIAEIQRLAKENGLAVNVKKPARKRGRPSKTGPATTQKKRALNL